MTAPKAPFLLILLTELRGTFRDRNTLVYSVVLPIVLYPTLLFVMLQLMQLQQRLDVDTVGLVQVRGGTSLIAGKGSEATTEDVAPFTEVEFERLVRENLPESMGRTREIRLEWSERTRAASSLSTEEARELIDGEPGSPHAILVIDELEDDDRALPDWSLRLYHDPTDPASASVAGDLASSVEGVRAEYRRKTFESASGQDPSMLEIFAIAPVDVSTAVSRASRVPALLLPMILIIMGTLGALYPAIDMTAGERERMTAETTAILPVPRHQLAFGKYLAIITCALLAWLLNLLSMWLTWPILRTSLGAGQGPGWQLGIGQTAAVLALGLVFLAFVAALVMGVATFARTFKEGQAFLSPIYTIAILPAMAAAVPGIRLTPGTACVPFLNVSLSIRSLVDGTADEHLLEILICVVACLVLAAASLAFVIRVFSSEETLIGTSGGGTLFARLRSMRHRQGTLS